MNINHCYKINERSEFTKSQNLLRMLISIVRNPNRTPSDIMNELEIPKANYYRYFTELSQIIPLAYDTSKRRFEFEKTLNIKNISRSCDEFYLFLLMLQAVKNLSCDSESAVSEKMAKLDAIDEGIRHHAENYFLLYESGLPTKDMAAKLYKISCAIIGRRRLSFHYSGIEKQYDLKADPYKVILDDFWYLHAYSHKRNACRSYKISRMENVEILNEIFEMPKPDSIDIGRISINWDFNGDKTTKVVLDFDKVVSMNIKENFFHKTQKLMDLSDGCVRMQVEIKNPSNMVNWILGFGQFVTIIEPESLKDELMKRLQEIKNKYL